MKAKRPSDLLPGAAGPDLVAPRAVFKPAPVLKTARRTRMVRDFIDILFLLVLDAFFFLWPATHIPTMSRRASALVLILVHALVITHIITSRVFPKWRARKIASTWSEAEKHKQS